MRKKSELTQQYHFHILCICLRNLIFWRVDGQHHSWLLLDSLHSPSHGVEYVPKLAILFLEFTRQDDARRRDEFHIVLCE